MDGWISLEKGQKSAARQPNPGPQEVRNNRNAAK